MNKCQYSNNFESCYCKNNSHKVTYQTNSCCSDSRYIYYVKCPSGPMGPQGPQGEAGSMGPQGPQGEAGPMGPQGPQGEAGPMGPQGAQGETGPVGPQGIQGEMGLTGLQGPQGEAGPMGPIGPQGPQGETGAIGPQGIQGETGPAGEQGPQGDTGPMGPQGPQGEPGASGGVLNYADFYALMPPNNSVTVAPGADVEFPQDGPNSNGGINRAGNSSFTLSEIGTYQILFQVSVSESGQLVLTLNGNQLDYTVAGRATGTAQIVGMVIIETTAINSVLTVRNPQDNTTALTITPLSGGTQPVSAHLVITQLR